MAEIENALRERIDTAYALAFGQHDWVTEDGELDYAGIADKLAEMVSGAVAEKKADRASVCVTRRDIMDAVFPKIVGPEGWADEDDPEVAEGVYKRLDAACWRMTAMEPDGQVQSRLNGAHGLVVCRTTVNPHRTAAVYATRDLGCLTEDALIPQSARAKKLADREAALTVMLITRVPEHAKKFDRSLIGGLRTAMNGAKALTEGAVQVALFETEDEPDDDGQ